MELFLGKKDESKRMLKHQIPAKASKMDSTNIAIKKVKQSKRNHKSIENPFKQTTKNNEP
jgi:hypothetical protein